MQNDQYLYSKTTSTSNAVGSGEFDTSVSSLFDSTLASGPSVTNLQYDVALVPSN